MTPFEIKWQAPEFEYRAKDVSWYWISIIIAVILLGLAVWQKNFLFGFFVLMAEMLVLTWANSEPSMIEFSLNEKGLLIAGGKLYAYAQVESFSAEDDQEEEWPELILQFKSRFRPPLRVRTPKVRSAEIQKALKPLLRQVEYERSIIDSLERFLGL